MKASTLILLAIIVSIPWIWNGVKFVNCDFESDYKCEVIHGAGVFVPPLAYLTVWFDSDGE